MKRTALIISSLVIGVVATLTAAQQPRPAATPAPKPAAPAGAAAPAAAATTPPNLSGIWGPRLVTSLNDNPPWRPEALAKYKAGNSDDDPLNKCKPPGVPRVTNMAFPWEIVQTPEIVYFLFEYDHMIRRVFIDAKHPDDLDPTWLGHSIGHWEGKTLVVDTVSFIDESWLDMRGHPHSEDLHTIERFTRSDDGKTLTHEVTIDDPKVYTAPWKGVTKTHQLRKDIVISEFICDVGSD